MDYKIVIDAGHGGNDPGASGNGMVEKDYTLKISKYLKDRFDDLGIPSKLTRSTDETLNESARVSRVKNAYGSGKNVIVLSNHLNAGGGDGAEVIYALRNDDVLAKKITEEFAKEGQNIRKYYQRRLPSNPSKDYYYIIRDTANNQSLLVEYAFIDSTGDDASLIKNNWEDLAEAVVRAVTSYVGKTYVPVSSGEYYTVKKGDSLWAVAKKYGLTVDELKKLNNLSSNSLSIGQVLKIKGSTDGKVSTYTVKSGDSLYSIANKYDTTVAELKKLNNLTSNTLSIGQILKLPDRNLNNSQNSTIYTVESGDTLYSIAKKFNISVDYLKTSNNLDTNTLTIGQTLIVPGTETSEVYTVKSGDNLYNIANKYDTTVAKIQNLNNLITTNLSIGQKLLIP